MTINKADISDIPQLCKLLDSLFSHEVEFKPDVRVQVNGLESILQNKQIGEIFVIRDEKEIIGMVNLLYTVSTALGGKVGLIEDMVVSSNYTNQGIGSKLISHVISYAKQNGCKRLTLLTDGDNLGAQKFYDKHGFDKSSMIAFRKLL